MKKLKFNWVLIKNPIHIIIFIMSCYKGLTKAEKKEIAIEIFKSFVEDEPVLLPAVPVPPQPVLAPHLMDGSVYNSSLQTKPTDVIMPVVMREVSATSHELETCQKLFLSAEKGCNILEFNECTGTWQLA